MADGPGGAPDERPTDLKALERSALREMVEHHTGSRSQLADRLGISERSLYRKLKALT
jgi:transcriptional regulator with PAS, ATPase and Fis domain